MQSELLFLKCAYLFTFSLDKESAFCQQPMTHKVTGYDKFLITGMTIYLLKHCLIDKETATEVVDPNKLATFFISKIGENVTVIQYKDVYFNWILSM